MVGREDDDGVVRITGVLKGGEDLHHLLIHVLVKLVIEARVYLIVQDGIQPHVIKVAKGHLGFRLVRQRVVPRFIEGGS